MTGGMILIGLINVAIGLMSYEPAPEKYEKIEFQLDAGVKHDAGAIDAATPTR